MPVFQCDRKTIEYSGILQFLVRVFSQFLFREILRCPLPISALSLLDIQLKGDRHLAKVHVIGSNGLAIAAHPPLGEGGSGLQRVFQLLHVDGVAVCGGLARCPIAGEVILVLLIQRFRQVGVQRFLHGVHPPGAVGGPLFQLRLGLRGGRRLFGGSLGIGVFDLVRIFRGFCRCGRTVAGAAMFPIRRIAVQAGGTEGLLLRGGLAVPVFRRGRRVLVIFLICWRFRILIVFFACRRFRILRIPFVRGRIGGLVSLLRGRFRGRRCLLSLAGARFGGLFLGDAGLFRIRIVRTPDLISPLSGFRIPGPLDGVVLALCQLLLDVRVTLPLLGSGAAGHGEPDDGDRFAIFPHFIGGIRTQAEGVAKVLPGFLAREGDELCLHGFPAVQERGVGLFPLFMGQQTADSISAPCDVLGLQVARAAPGIVAAQEALVLLHMIEVQRAVWRILFQICKGEDRFNSRAVSSLPVSRLDLLRGPGGRPHQLLRGGLAVVLDVDPVQMEAHGGIGNGHVIFAQRKFQDLFHRQTAGGAVEHVLHLEGVGDLLYVKQIQRFLGFLPGTVQGPPVGAGDAVLPEGILVQLAVLRVFGQLWLIFRFRPDGSGSVVNDVFPLIEDLERVVLQAGPVLNGQGRDGVSVKVKLLPAALHPPVQREGDGRQVHRRIADGQVGPQLPSLDDGRLVQAVDKGAICIQGIFGVRAAGVLRRRRVDAVQARGLCFVGRLHPRVGFVTRAQAGFTRPVLRDGVVKVGGVHAGALHRGVSDLVAPVVILGQVLQLGPPEILLVCGPVIFGGGAGLLTRGIAGPLGRLLRFRREQALVCPAVAGIDQFGLDLVLSSRGMHSPVDVQIDVRTAAGAVHIDVVPLLVPDSIRHAGAFVGEGDLLLVVLLFAVNRRIGFFLYRACIGAPQGIDLRSNRPQLVRSDLTAVVQPDLLHGIADHRAVGVVLGKIPEVKGDGHRISRENRLDRGNLLSIPVLNRDALAAQVHIAVSIFLVDFKFSSRIIAGGDLQLHGQGEAGGFPQGCLEFPHAVPAAVPPVLGDGQVHVAQPAVGDGADRLPRDLLAAVCSFILVVLTGDSVAGDPGGVDLSLGRGASNSSNRSLSDFGLPDVNFVRLKFPNDGPSVPDGISVLLRLAQRDGDNLVTSLFAIHRHFHRLPVDGVAVVHPVLLDQDPIVSSRAVGDDGRIVSGAAVDGGFIGGIPVLLQDQVFIPAALFVILREILEQGFPRLRRMNGNFAVDRIFECASLREINIDGPICIHCKGENLACLCQRLFADGAVQGEGHRPLLGVGFPLLFHRILYPVADGIGDLGGAAAVYIGHPVLCVSAAAAAGQGKRVALQKIRFALALVDRRLHPAVLQLPALVVVFGRAGADGQAAQVLRREFSAFLRPQRLGDLRVFPGVLTAHRPGLERQLHPDILQRRLEGRRFPDLGGVDRHRAGELVGKGSPVVEVCIVRLPCKVRIPAGQLFQRAGILVQHPDDVRHAAVFVHRAEYLGVVARMLTSEILPDHIDILVALRIVLGQVRKLDVLFLLPIERDRQNAAPVIPDGRGRRVALPGPIAPQLEFTRRAVLRIRRVLPDFGGLIVLEARERQVQGAAVIELPHLCAHVGRAGVVVGDLEVVALGQDIRRDAVGGIQPAVAFSVSLRGLLHRVVDPAAVQIVLPQAADGDGAAGGVVRVSIRVLFYLQLILHLRQQPAEGACRIVGVHHEVKAVVNGLCDAACAAQIAPAELDAEAEFVLQHIVPAIIGPGGGILRRIAVVDLHRNVVVISSGGAHAPLHMGFLCGLPAVAIGCCGFNYFRQRAVRDGDRIGVVPVVGHRHFRDGGQAHPGERRVLPVFQLDPFPVVDPEPQRRLIRIRPGAHAVLVVVVHPIERLLLIIPGGIPAFHRHYRICVNHRHQGQAQHQRQQSAEQPPPPFLRELSLWEPPPLPDSFALIQHKPSPL